MSLQFSNLSYLIWLIILVIVLVFLWRRGKSFSYLFFFSLFWLYILVAVEKIIFPLPFEVHFYGPCRLPPQSKINLIPFYFGESPYPSVILQGLVNNVLLTVPLGFGIHFVKYIKPQRILSLSLIVGLGTELFQLVISILISYSYRVIDVNDVLMNALGVILGYLIFRLFANIYIRIIRSQGMKPKGLFSYIYDIALRYENKPLFGKGEIDASIIQ